MDETAEVKEHTIPDLHEESIKEQFERFQRALTNFNHIFTDLDLKILNRIDSIQNKLQKKFNEQLKIVLENLENSLQEQIEKNQLKLEEFSNLLMNKFEDNRELLQREISDIKDLYSSENQKILNLIKKQSLDLTGLFKESNEKSDLIIKLMKKNMQKIKNKRF